MTFASGIFPVPQSAAELDEQAQAALGFVDGLYALMRAVVSASPERASVAQLADEIAARATALGLPFRLQFLGATVYCNRILLPVDIDRVAQVVQVARGLDALGAQEMIFEQALSGRTLLVLAEALTGGMDRADVQVPGVLCRPLVGPVWGSGAKPIDRDVAARVWLVLASAAAERLSSSPSAPWDWATSAGIVRRLEQVVRLDGAVALRALELAPQPWKPGRRAVAVAVRAMVALAHLRVAPETLRLAGHVALIAAVHGINSELTSPIDSAAQMGLQHASHAPGTDAVVSARHRLQVVALLRAVANRAGTGSDWPGPLGAVLVSWDIERRRGGGTREERQTTMEALAAADLDPYLLGGKTWLRVLVAAMSATPPGSVVVDAQNQLGAVLDASGRSGAGRPVLLADGQMVQVDAPLVPLLRET